jgi:hypothetical protein
MKGLTSTIVQQSQFLFGEVIMYKSDSTEMILEHSLHPLYLKVQRNFREHSAHLKQ